METGKNNSITVLVPVYNTPADSMDRLFQSLKDQTDSDFFLLIMDDGSNAVTADYLEEKKKEFLHCDVIHGEHAGVSKTRNCGLGMVNTKYVAFSDADDAYSPGFINEAKQYLEKYDADVIYGVMEHNPPRKDLIQSGDREEFFEGFDAIRKVRMALLDIMPRELPYTILGTPCARIYKTELALDTGFPETVSYFEDQIFNREYLKRVRSVLVAPNVWYTYYQNSFSAMRKEMKIGFYEKTKSYWTEFYRLNMEESEEWKTALRIKQLDFYYAVVNIDYASKSSDIKRKDALLQMEEIAKHPMIADAVENLLLSDPKLAAAGFSKSDRMNLRFLKEKKYRLLLTEKKLLALVKHRSSL